ncbi:slit homolog 1 protein-like [Branchiostoma floridae]|uniref:Slit homolog 1 protein-like n=1 Tax=Branchiostoma floridae TaxID=7739 RepID=A0A9J7N3P1_BRAFL|nr:slit homolog 1 protein-like [Branchiostoma floridae]
MMTFLVILLVAMVTASSACPSVCRCTGTRADCSRAHLTAIPSDLPHNTTELILRENTITNINNNTALLTLKNLSSLDLQDNLISVVVSHSFPGHLQKLNLAKNSFQCSEQDFLNLESLHNLKELDLSYNNIEVCIPDNFPTSLQVLRLDKIAYHGNLTLGPRQFENLTALTLLSLEQNDIVNFPSEALGKLSTLTDLSLARNKLRFLDDLVLPSSVKLQLLDLSFNELSQISTHSFSGIEKSLLKSLSLSGNKIKTIAPSAFSQMPQLKNLTMDQNPWHCGCDLLPFREWLENVTVRELLGITKGHALNCESPEDLKGRMVSEVPLHYFCSNTTVPPSTTLHQTTIPSNVTMVTVSNVSTMNPLTLPPDKRLFNFSIDRISEQTVQLSWACSDPNIVFQVSWSSKHSSMSYSGWEKGTSFGIDNLLPNTKYHICLMAMVEKAATGSGKEVQSSCMSIITTAKHDGLAGAGLGLAVAFPICCLVIGGLGVFVGRRFCERKSGGYQSFNAQV